MGIISRLLDQTRPALAAVQIATIFHVARQRDVIVILIRHAIGLELDLIQLFVLFENIKSVVHSVGPFDSTIMRMKNIIVIGSHKKR